MKVAWTGAALFVLLTAAAAAVASPYLWVLTRDGGYDGPPALALVAVPSGRVICERPLGGHASREGDLFWLRGQAGDSQLCALLPARSGLTTYTTDLYVVDLAHLCLGRRLRTWPAYVGPLVSLPGGRLRLEGDDGHGHNWSHELQFDGKWRVTSERDADGVSGALSPDHRRLWVPSLEGYKWGGLREMDAATDRVVAQYRLPSAEWEADRVLPLPEGGALVEACRVEPNGPITDTAVFLCRSGQMRRFPLRTGGGYFKLGAVAEAYGSFWLGLHTNTASPAWNCVR
jgi:hypothetical protein